jgi:hypothetical protein
LGPWGSVIGALVPKARLGAPQRRTWRGLSSGDFDLTSQLVTSLILR